jgi:two-component system sensor histidine kinase DegS
LSSQIEINIFRIVQEALNNVRQHSKATSATLELYFTPESIKIVIEDNGQGFTISNTKDASNFENRLGLVGIKWRIRSLGGTLHIDSDNGTKLTAEIKI